MTYDEICQYVFQEEGIAWEMRASKKRDHELVLARQLSMYCGNWFYPKITWSELAKPFGKDHATAMHSIKTINDLIDYDKELRKTLFSYLDYIRKQKKNNDEKETFSIIHDHKSLEAVLELVSKMELVAKVYCEITGKKIVENN